MNLQDFLSKITGQSDRLESVVGKLTEALATVELKDAEISALKSSVSDFEAKIEAAPKQEAIDALEAEKIDLSGKLEVAVAEVAALPEKVNAEAARVVASNGHASVETVVSGAPVASAEPIDRAEFNAMSPAHRLAFCKSGGKIS